MIFETHAHYDDEEFNQDREEVLHSLKENQIGFVVNASSSIESIQKTIALTQKYDFLYGAVGVHPEETKGLNDTNFEWVKQMVKQPKIVAVGEIGLDYYWKEPEPEIQKKWFEEQIELAREVQLPMIIHSRDAAQDTLEIMKAHHAEEIGGVIHCFSYSKEIAREYLNMGFYLGIGGVVTFKNAKKLKEVTAYVPLDRILLETDCPYLAPVPNRGKRNSSLNLIYVAEEIARIKEIKTEEVIAQTEENAKKMYHIL